MRYCANISILFREFPFLERFARAREAGFAAVEFWWPSGEDLAAVESAIKDSGIKVALFNFDAGDMPAGDRGFLGHPVRQVEFHENVPVALAFADRVGCKRLNALVGHLVDGVSLEEQLRLVRENIQFAADAAAKQGAIIMIEAVNTYENGPYLIPTTKAAAEMLKSVGRDNVELQYDIYHMQRMEGNLVATIREHFGSIGHFQVADSPGRMEPGTGEINYLYVIQQLEELNYEGYIGLEYKPSKSTTEESLKWLPKDARGGDLGADALTIY